MKTKLLSVLVLITVLSVLAFCIPAMLVSAAAGAITLSQTSGVPGTYVAVTGTGWTSTGTITINTITFDSIVITGAAPVAGGNFSAAFSVPSLPRGPHSVTASSNLAESATSSFTITPAVIAGATTGKVGDQISVIGNGFNASSAVSIFLDGTLVGSSTTDNFGTFGSVPVSIPETPAGSHTLNASDASGIATPAGFTISPKLTASGLGAAVGGQLTISGKGYAASSPLTAVLDTTPIAVSINTNAVGSFTAAVITVPPIAAGPHSLKVQDSLGNNSTVSLTTTSALKTNPSGGPVGTSVSVAGNGYVPNVKITLTYDNAAIQTSPSSIVSDASGNFSATFVVPATAAGTFIVQASDGTNSANTPFRASASGGLATSKGAVGDSVQVQGSGFAGGATVSIRYDNIQIATATADTGGSLSTSVIIPASQSGEHKILASDGVNSITLTFVVSPSASASPTSGAVGSSATVQGTGFSGGAAIALQFDGAEIAKSNANSTGGFSIAFTVPSTSAGAHKLLATDGVNSVNLSLSVTASANVSVSSGAVGSTIRINGSAFIPAATISIKFDTGAVANTAADANGRFDVTFQTPAAKSGNHIIYVSDGTTTKSFNFAIDAAPPPVPALVTPPLSGKADSLALFEWTPVTDANGGITYTFQLASDANFSLLLVTQSGLSSNTYKLIEAEKLKTTGKDSPYYWRVKAVDAASDESDWSTALTFVVGFQMPVFGWYLIAAGAAIIIFLLGLIVGRRTASR
jgi:hypothetical protein